MRSLRAEVRPVQWPLVRPLATAHGSIARRCGLVVTLVDEHGRRGVGEATPLPDFGTETLVATRSALGAALERLDGATFDETAAALAACTHAVAHAPCARAAIDTALLDLEAQRAGVSLARWLRAREGVAGAPASRVVVQALVGGESPEEVALAARGAAARGFEAFKLKLCIAAGRLDLGLDLDRVAALRDAVGPAPRIRLDANEAFTRDEALAALAALERFAPDYVEQPVPRADVEALAVLGRESAVAVAADEALLGTGFDACLAATAAPVFVVKPAAWGGLSDTLPRLRRARDAGIRVVVSNLIEGAVGRAAATALAAAVAAPGEVHGLGTQDLLVRDASEVREVRAGAIELDDRPGLGVRLPRAASPGPPPSNAHRNASRPGPGPAG